MPNLILSDLNDGDLLDDNTISGAETNDIILGDSGNDRLLGLGGDDILSGGAGNDTLYGGAGNDQMNGGTGTDTVYENGDFNYYLTNSKLYGNGVNSLNSIEKVVLVGGAGANNINAKTFIGSTILKGLGGNDKIQGGNGQDALYGGSENDQLFGNFGNDWLFGDSGNDLLDGGAGNDVLFGGTGRDTLNGGAGTDFLNGGDGIDLVRANILFDATLSTSQLTMDGGIGVIQSILSVDTLVNIEKATLIGSNFDNHLDASNFVVGDGMGIIVSSVSLTGNGGNDFIQGSYGNDNLIGNQGNDTIVGGIGLDIISGTDASAKGIGERDVLGSGYSLDSDRFILGDQDNVYYLDAQGSTESFARIMDFGLYGGSAGPDRIELNGVASDYRLASTIVEGQVGVGIYRKEGSSRILGDDDLIGLVQGTDVQVSSLNLNNSNHFLFAQKLH